LRAFLDHQITTEDLLLIITSICTLIGFFAILVVTDIRYQNWKRTRAYRKLRDERRENLRNPIYGMKPKDEP
jgi:hypothetical protein